MKSFVSVYESPQFDISFIFPIIFASLALIISFLIFYLFSIHPHPIAHLTQGPLPITLLFYSLSSSFQYLEETDLQYMGSFFSSDYRSLPERERKLLSKQGSIWQSGSQRGVEIYAARFLYRIWHRFTLQVGSHLVEIRWVGGGGGGEGGRGYYRIPRGSNAILAILRIRLWVCRKWQAVRVMRLTTSDWVITIQSASVWNLSSLSTIVCAYLHLDPLILPFISSSSLLLL